MYASSFIFIHIQHCLELDKDTLRLLLEEVHIVNWKKQEKMFTENIYKIPSVRNHSNKMLFI